MSSKSSHRNKEVWVSIHNTSSRWVVSEVENKPIRQGLMLICYGETKSILRNNYLRRYDVTIYNLSKIFLTNSKSKLNLLTHHIKYMGNCCLTLTMY